MVIEAILTGPEDSVAAKRIECRRQREQQRLQKLGPGRLRTIGADIAGVKNQLEDKRRHDQAEMEAQRRADEEDAAIRRYLVQIDAEDAMARRKEALTLRNDWQVQARDRHEMDARAAQLRAIPIDPETCAPGAAQVFEGEDPLRLERLRLQAMQLKQWTLQQMDEKRQRHALLAEDEARYGRYLCDIARIAESLAQENESERAAVAVEIQRMNQVLESEKRATDRQRQQLEQQQNALEIAQTLQSNLVSENPRQAALPGVPMDRRVRVDHWKGLSVEQTRHVLQGNEALLAERAAEQQRQRREQVEDAQRQAALHRALVVDDVAQQQRKAQQELEVQRVREQQNREAVAREAANAQQARGKIEPSFFQAFGRSYR